MKIYSKQYYSLGQRLHKSFRGMIQEKGYLAPQFSTFSGYSKANPCKIFNICILDKDIEYDGSFVHAFLQYHNECLEERICSLVFFHPDNRALAMFIGKQIQTITTQYINSADLSEEFVIEWLGNHYMKGKLPNRLDYVLNRPFINLKVIRCPMCGCSYGPGVYFSIPPFHLTDNDIRVVRQSGYPEEPGTGESIDIDI